MVSLMCLYVWYVCRYIGSQSKQYSRCLQHSGKVFILCCSLICSGFEPFRLEKQLLSIEGEIFLVTNMATPLGNEANLSWSDLPQSLNTFPNPCSSLYLSSFRFAIWLSESWFPTFRSVHIWTISTLYALFYYQFINLYLNLINF